MNSLFRRSASMASTPLKQSLTALISIEASRLSPSLSKSTTEELVLFPSGACGGEIRSVLSSVAFERPGFGFQCRDFHFSAVPLEFRASDVARAEYAVDDFSDDEKVAGKKGRGDGDEGLEISKLGISEEIVSALAKKGITKLFPIQVIFSVSFADSLLLVLVLSKFTVLGNDIEFVCYFVWMLNWVSVFS